MIALAKQAVFVTPNFLELAQRQWDAGRPSDLPGHVGTQTVETPYIPRRGRLFVVRTEWAPETKSGREVFETERRRVRRARRPAAKYSVESLTVSEGDELRINEILIDALHASNHVNVYPPGVAITEAKPIPRSRGKEDAPATSQTRPATIPLGMATASIRASGVRAASPFAR